MYPLIQLSETFSIPTYLLYLSVLYSFLLIYVVKRANTFGKPKEIALDLSLIIMVFGFIGARSFHIFFENWNYYSEHQIEIFYFWQGGFVYYGGAILAFISAFAYVYSKKLNALEWMDFFAPIIALGYGFGRISCFLAGCCYGRVCDYPWGVHFNFDGTSIFRHPTQLYASIIELVIFFILILFEKRKYFKLGGKYFFFWLLLHSISRILMEFFRDDFRGNFYFGISISTWISGILFVICAHKLLMRNEKLTNDQNE